MRTKRFALGAAAAAVMTIALATPALAADSPVVLNPDHKNVLAKDFSNKECTDQFANLPANKDGWHFLLPDASGENFTSITLSFEKPFGGGNASVVITSRDANAPNTGSGWSGYIGATGSGAYMHVWLITDAGWKLLDGSGLVETGGDKQNFFNLSHVCAGTPTSPSPSTSTTATPSDPQSPSASSSTPPGGNLPQTGFPVAALVSTAALMLVAGAALLAVRRRRDIREEV